jgi:hypothetical protein
MSFPEVEGVRKGFISTGLLFAGFLLLSIMLFYGERGPDGRHPSSAIPEPAGDIPFLYFEGKRGGAWIPVIELAAIRAGGVADFPVTMLSALSPLFAKMEETASLLVLEGDKVFFSTATKFPAKMTRALAGGSFPEDIGEGLSDLRFQKVASGGFVLTNQSGIALLHLSVNGGITLLASSREAMEKMSATLERQKEPSVALWRLEERWPNHVLFSDGGLLSGVAAMEGFPVNRGILRITAAWREHSEGGRMKWKAEGLETIFHPSVLENLQGTKWDESLSIPDPLVAALGINMPQGASALLDSRLGEQLIRYGKEGDLFERMLPGPVVASFSGSSKFLVFSRPGFLLQFPERGKRGEEFVETFWKAEWSSLVPGVETLDTFTVGGTTAIPFSILAAANFRMVYLGLMDRDALRYERFLPIQKYSPVLKDIGRAFLWAYLDIPKIADALQNLAKTGTIAERMGKNIGMSPNRLLRAASALEELGIVTLVMPGLGEGFLEWRNSGEEKVANRK